MMSNADSLSPVTKAIVNIKLGCWPLGFCDGTPQKKCSASPKINCVYKSLLQAYTWFWLKTPKRKKLTGYK